jgi:hypothetical protein
LFQDIHEKSRTRDNAWPVACGLRLRHLKHARRKLKSGRGRGHPELTLVASHDRPFMHSFTSGRIAKFSVTTPSTNIKVIRPKCTEECSYGRGAPDLNCLECTPQRVSRSRLQTTHVISSAPVKIDRTTYDSTHSTLFIYTTSNLQT